MVARAGARCTRNVRDENRSKRRAAKGLANARSVQASRAFFAILQMLHTPGKAVDAVHRCGIKAYKVELQSDALASTKYTADRMSVIAKAQAAHLIDRLLLLFVGQIAECQRTKGVNYIKLRAPREVRLMLSMWQQMTEPTCQNSAITQFC